MTKNFIIIQRSKNFTVKNIKNYSILKTDEKYHEISSTKVRELLKKGDF